MERMEVEVAYYTCLNKNCFKYRGVFTEGDPLHLNCERAQLFQEDRMPGWALVAAPVVLALLAAGAAAFVLMRRQRSIRRKNIPPMGERRTEIWSGGDRINNERKSHAAPPPIKRD